MRINDVLGYRVDYLIDKGDTVKATKVLFATLDEYGYPVMSENGCKQNLIDCLDFIASTKGNDKISLINIDRFTHDLETGKINPYPISTTQLTNLLDRGELIDTHFKY